MKERAQGGERTPSTGTARGRRKHPTPYARSSGCCLRVRLTVPDRKKERKYQNDDEGNHAATAVLPPLPFLLPKIFTVRPDSARPNPALYSFFFLLFLFFVWRWAKETMMKTRKKKKKEETARCNKATIPSTLCGTHTFNCTYAIWWSVKRWRWWPLHLKRNWRHTNSYYNGRRRVISIGLQPCHFFNLGWKRDYRSFHQLMTFRRRVARRCHVVVAF